MDEVLRQCPASVSAAAVLGPCHEPTIVKARYEIWALVRELVMSNGRHPSFPQIGAWFNRNQSSIRYGVLRHKGVSPGLLRYRAGSR